MKRLIVVVASALGLVPFGCGPGDDSGETSGSVGLIGAINKGPFVLGSSVSISALDRVGNPTGQVFNTQTLSDLGEFSATVEALGPASLQATGFYWNEVSGQLSSANLTLRAFYEIGSAGSQSAYINAITHLAYGRVGMLLGQGTSYPAAIAQGEQELRAALAIGAPGIDPQASGVQMNIIGGDSLANAYLLAVSSVLAKAAELRGDPVDSHLQQLVNTIASDLADDGDVAQSVTQELDQAELALDGDLVMKRLAARLAELGSSAVVPDIHQILDSDQDDVVNAQDNCRYVANTDQADADGDDVGDACDYAFSYVDVGDVSCAIYAAGSVEPEGSIVCFYPGGYPSHTSGFDETHRQSDHEPPPTIVPTDIDMLIVEPSCGLMTDGTLECWGPALADCPGTCRPDQGDDCNGLCPLPNPEARFSEIAGGGGHVCGIRSDAGHEGDLDCWMPSSNGNEIFHFTGSFTQPVAAGDLGCALETGSQQVSCFVLEGQYQGQQLSKDLGMSMPDLAANDIALSGMSTNYRLCLSDTADVVACFDIRVGQTMSDHSVTAVTDLPTEPLWQIGVSDPMESCEFGVVCGLTAAGAVTCAYPCGEIPEEPPDGFFPEPPSGTDYRQLEVGGGWACVLDPDGRLTCWGLNG